jgi:redox-sensing transcriptional repressor
MRNRPIPDVVVRRLTQYYHTLQQCHERNMEIISSQTMGEMLNLTAAQIRKDLSYFGGFGKQGIGYNVATLLEQLRYILGLRQTWRMALVGVGNLGRALLHYEGFIEEGFTIVALFDSDPSKVGTSLNKLIIHDDADIVQLVPELDIDIALLAIPPDKAQEVTNMFIEAGVKAILNYAPVTVRVPKGVWVRQVDPLAALESMTFYLASTDITK